MLRISKTEGAALLILLIAIVQPCLAGVYKTPGEVSKELKTVAVKYSGTAVVKKIAVSPGKRLLEVLELVTKRGNPAIFLIANMEGDNPIATSAALELADRLLGEWKGDLMKYSWYIVPIGNPDGYARYFSKPLYESGLNNRPVNADMDDRADEDGPEDLNGDGLITMMRQKHPEGKWIAVKGNTVLMKKADRAKGETGIYRLFSEGIDNDGDGKINEDGPGGYNPGHNFPHRFKYYSKTTGTWPASERETTGVLKYMFDHPEIVMALSFSRLNTLQAVPPSDKKAESGKDKYKVPAGIARKMGIDPNREFHLDELVELAREATGFRELTAEMVLQFLGVAAAVNPDKKDSPYWEELAKKYKNFLKENKLDGKRLDAKKIPGGSFEEWAYYQYGVWTFALDFWTVPVKEEKKEDDGLTAEKIEQMTNEEFIALGRDKIDAFIQKSGRKGFNADMIIGALKGGMLSTKKIAEMMRKMEKTKTAEGVDVSDKALYEFNKDAFVPWKRYKHPTLGEVEIGGIKPYAFVTPPSGEINEIISQRIPFICDMARMLPSFEINNVTLKRVSSDVWRVKAWIVNNGFLPYPTHQGKRNRRPAPLVVSVAGKDIKILEGKKRIPIDLLDGSGGYKEVEWLISVEDGSSLDILLTAPAVHNVRKSVVLKTGGAR